MDAVVEVVRQVIALDPGRPTVIVAIDGKGGAGKTTLARGRASEVAAAGRRVDLVHLADFYLPSKLRPHARGERKPLGGDFDWMRLRDEVLLPLRQGRRAKYARYDWDTDSLAEAHEIQTGALVVIEGVSSARQELAALYDLRIWVNCPRDERLKRRIAIDGELYRGRWERDWMPSEDRYVREHRPHETADLVVNGGAG